MSSRSDAGCVAGIKRRWDYATHAVVGEDRKEEKKGEKKRIKLSHHNDLSLENVVIKGSKKDENDESSQGPFIKASTKCLKVSAQKEGLRLKGRTDRGGDASGNPRYTPTTSPFRLQESIDASKTPLCANSEHAHSEFVVEDGARRTVEEVLENRQGSAFGNTVHPPTSPGSLLRLPNSDMSTPSLSFSQREAIVRLHVPDYVDPYMGGYCTNTGARKNSLRFGVSRHTSYPSSVMETHPCMTEDRKTEVTSTSNALAPIVHKNARKEQDMALGSSQKLLDLNATTSFEEGTLLSSTFGSLSLSEASQESLSAGGASVPLAKGSGISNQTLSQDGVAPSDPHKISPNHDGVSIKSVAPTPVFPKNLDPRTSALQIAQEEAHLAGSSEHHGSYLHRQGRSNDHDDTNGIQKLMDQDEAILRISSQQGREARKVQAIPGRMSRECIENNTSTFNISAARSEKSTHQDATHTEKLGHLLKKTLNILGLHDSLYLTGRGHDFDLSSMLEQYSLPIKESDQILRQQDALLSLLNFKSDFPETKPNTYAHHLNETSNSAIRAFNQNSNSFVQTNIPSGDYETHTFTAEDSKAAEETCVGSPKHQSRIRALEDVTHRMQKKLQDLEKEKDTLQKRVTKLEADIMWYRGMRNGDAMESRILI